MDLRITIYCALSISAIFGLVSAVFYFGDWSRLGIVTAIGLFVGILLAPEIEPKKFKRGWLLQMIAGLFAGLLVGLFFGLDESLIVSCGVIGGFLGWIAPTWVKHVQIP